MTQRKQTKQLHQWYGAVECGNEGAWAEAVMSDPEDNYRLHAPRELRRKIREDVPDLGCA
jgi:hypothetical protein